MTPSVVTADPESKPTMTAKFLPGVLPSMGNIQDQFADALSQVIQFHTGKCDEGSKQLSFSHILTREKLCTLQLGDAMAILFEGDPRINRELPNLPVQESSPGIPSLLPVDYGRILRGTGLPQPWTPELAEGRKELVSALERFQNMVPAELALVVSRLGISRNHPEIAVVASAVPEFLDLLRTNPQLSLLFVSNAFINSPEDPGFEEWRNLIIKGAREIAAKLGFPHRPLILRLIRRLRVNDVPELDRLQRVLNDPAHSELLYNLNRPLAAKAIHLLADSKARFHPRFTRQFNEIALRNSAQAEETLTLIRDTSRLIRATDTKPDRIERIQSLNGLQQLHDELNDEYLAGSYACRKFNKPCPIRCPDWIEPIGTSESLVKANRYFRNCSPIKSDQIHDGSYYIFIVKLSGFKRAMLGVELKQGKMIFEQLYYQSNHPVPASLERKVKAWVEVTPWMGKTSQRP